MDTALASPQPAALSQSQLPSQPADRAATRRPAPAQVGLSASSLRSVIDRLSARVFAADPTETLKAAGLSDVRSYSITVGGDARHYVTATTPDGDILDGSAWSQGAAAALVLAQLDADRSAEASSERVGFAA